MIFIFDQWQFLLLLISLFAGQLLTDILILLLWEARLQHKNHQTASRVLDERYLEQLDTLETEIPSTFTDKWRSL